VSWNACALTAAGLIVLITGARLAQDAETGTASWDATRAEASLPTCSSGCRSKPASHCIFAGARAARR
jgi:hypothetical protein